MWLNNSLRWLATITEPPTRCSISISSNKHYNLLYIQMHSAVKCTFAILKWQEVPAVVEWCCTVQYDRLWCILHNIDLKRWETAHHNCNLTTQNMSEHLHSTAALHGKVEWKNQVLKCFIAIASSERKSKNRNIKENANRFYLCAICCDLCCVQVQTLLWIWLCIHCKTLETIMSSYTGLHTDYNTIEHI